MVFGQDLGDLAAGQWEEDGEGCSEVQRSRGLARVLWVGIVSGEDMRVQSNPARALQNLHQARFERGPRTKGTVEVGLRIRSDQFVDFEESS